MVNVRKIGAIATSALFIGATFGMASAAFQGATFNTDMLAKGGVAKAQLVVGADAPGLTADTQSAEEIKEAVKANLASTVGGDISIEFGANDLHDGSGMNHNSDTFSATYGDAETVYPLNNWTNGTMTLRFDDNGDTDLKDTGDYDLYNAIAIIDRIAGDIQFAYNLSAAEHATYSNANGSVEPGEVVKIRGDKYVVTDLDTTEDEMELGPAITATLRPVESADVESARASIISGTKKVLYDKDGILYFYDGTSLLDSFDVIDQINKTAPGSYPYEAVDDTDINSDEFKAYKIYALNTGGNVTAGETLKITMVEESQLEKLVSGEEGVMGYSSVVIGDSDWYDNGVGTYFLGDPISLVKGETIDLPDTYYQLKYTTTKKFDIKRKKTSAIASGMTLKDTEDPGKDFLKAGASITVSTTGGTVQSDGPTLDIVDEDTADTDMNLVLIGGPAANTMTADLVTNGKSEVTWETSDGDIEVIKNPIKSNSKYAIIVAGKHREATKAAADALAAEL